jgi:hypothetical protein
MPTRLAKRSIVDLLNSSLGIPWCRFAWIVAAGVCGMAYLTETLAQPRGAGKSTDALLFAVVRCNVWLFEN